MSPDTAADFEPLVPLSRLVELLGVPKKTLYTWCSAGSKGFPYYRVGKHSRVPLSEIDAWLRQYAASPGVRDLTPRPRPLEGKRLPDRMPHAAQQAGNCTVDFRTNGSPSSNRRVTEIFGRLAQRNPNIRVIRRGRPGRRHADAVAGPEGARPGG